MWWKVLIAVSALLLAAAVSLRTGLIGAVAPDLILSVGWFGPDADRLTSLVLAGSLAALMISLTYLHLRRRRSANDASPQQGSPTESGAVVGAVAALLGLVAAVTGTVAILFPDTPYDAAAPACRGAFLQGSDFYAQTVLGGVSARNGPGRGFSQVDRFEGDCTLGFEGYCIGEPIQNDLTRLPDSRWLILNGGKALVSSAVMQVQSQPTSKAAQQPAKQCDDLGGYPEPSGLEFAATIKPRRANEVRLSSTATGAPLVGYAQKIVNSVDRGYPYSPIGSPKTNSPDFTGTWLAGSDVNLLDNATGTMQLVASACLSAAFPIGEPVVYKARFQHGTLVALKALKELPSDADVLASTACYGTPK